MNIFLLSGTPGTGKTAIARRLEQDHGFKGFSLGDIVIKEKLYSGEDPSRDTKIVDLEKFDEYFSQFFEKYAKTADKIVLEGHYADLIENQAVIAAVILRCHPITLEQRLNARNYSIQKIRENIQAEIVGDCTSYMLEYQECHPEVLLFEVDSSANSEKKTAAIVADIFNSPNNHIKQHAGQKSWLSDPSVPIEKYLDK